MIWKQSNSYNKATYFKQTSCSGQLKYIIRYKNIIRTCICSPQEQYQWDSKVFLRVQKESLPFNQMLSIPDSQLNWNYFHRNLCPRMQKNGIYYTKTHFPLTTICVGVTPFLSMSRWRGGTVSDWVSERERGCSSSWWGGRQRRDAMCSNGELQGSTLLNYWSCLSSQHMQHGLI